jgi:hypothetical protein
VRAELGVEHPDHDPDRRIELLRGKRRIEVAGVIVRGEHDRGRPIDTRATQDRLAPRVADDDRHLGELGVVLGRRPGRDRDDGFGGRRRTRRRDRTAGR